MGRRVGGQGDVRPPQGSRQLAHGSPGGCRLPEAASMATSYPICIAAGVILNCLRVVLPPDPRRGTWGFLVCV